MNDNNKTPDTAQPKSNQALIAEFMGIKEIESAYDSYGHKAPFWYAAYFGYRTPAFSEPNKSVAHLLSENKFNNSWDWLMPVVEKIEKDCKCDVYISGHWNWECANVSIYDCKKNEIVRKVNKCKFQCVFDAVVEFIKWWNNKQFYNNNNNIMATNELKQHYDDKLKNVYQCELLNIEILSESAEKIASELSYGDINSAICMMQEISIKAKLSEHEKDKCRDVLSILYGMKKEPNFVKFIQNKFK